MAECETGAVDVLEALLERDESYPPWGFQLKGGIDFGQPLAITRVTPRSPAARIGLKAGDMVTEIGDLPTTNLTQQEALDALAQYGLSLILTVERKARGSVPTNPVLHGPENAAPIKNYQTYNMSSGTQRPVAQPGFYRSPSCSSPADSQRSFSPSFTYPKLPQQQRPARPAIYQTYDLNGPRAISPSAPKHDYRFETVKARPFEVPPNKPVSSSYTSPPPVAYQPQGNDYDQPDSPGSQTQSRTFKILQGLMENEDDAPPCALTPGYSPAAMSSNHDDQPPAPSVVHKQYNTPITLYSQKSICDSVNIDGMSLEDHDGDDDEPKPYLNSSVMQMVQEMDEEDKRVKSGKPSKYNALGHRRPETRNAENPFSQASMSYKAYARQFAPFGGSTAIDDARELQEKKEREQQYASQSDYYISPQSVETRNGADDFVAQSDEFKRDSCISNTCGT